MENTLPFNSDTSPARISGFRETSCHVPTANDPRGDSLNHRQQQILKMVAEDLTTKEMAWRLGISSRTIEFHRTNIKVRLGVKGVAGMVRYAIRTGLLEP